MKKGKKYKRKVRFLSMKYRQTSKNNSVVLLKKKM